MSRGTRSRWVATMKSAILIALLVVFLCEVGAVLVAKESVAFQAPKSLLAKAQQRPQQNQENERLRLIRRSQPGWIQIDKPALETLSSDPSVPTQPESRFDPSMYSGQWNSNSEKETTPKEFPYQSDFLGDNELMAGGDPANEKSNVQQLNWHEAQLARLHGLGPAEIAALSTWQHRLRLHPQPNRLVAWHQPPSFSPRNLLPLYGKSLFQQVLTPFDNVDPTYKVGEGPSNHSPLPLARKTNQTRYEEANENLLLLPLWPKRSSDTKNKSDRENKNRNGSSRKEKAETTSGSSSSIPSGKSNKAKNSRKQQQQQQQQESSHRSKSGVATSGINGAGQHEHGRPSAERISPTSDVSRMNRNLATQFLLRSPRENRQYDIPIIECPPAEDGMERFACPTADMVGRFRCIDDHVLCDGFIDCPGGEDEGGQSCMFYKTMKAHLDLVADALLRWVRGR